MFTNIELIKWLGQLDYLTRLEKCPQCDIKFKYVDEGSIFTGCEHSVDDMIKYVEETKVKT